ncbi:periplasmic heavy metal sensor [Sphingomonas psychrotolerans]|uniref:Periplasmic heavy metal sensor n=1 Tax=Sphingomonas psychrotolerans TaxID=1327635 RepID=A0ABU3N6T8_9SPHN|nr:periplasmic heavy metal sensor [Sphingomonas psychrotolerans]MDT8760240.1 periplasmic heavy metal sensor [Sphingomonas psychrotolerans]
MTGILKRGWILAATFALTAGTVGLAGAGLAQSGQGMARMHRMHGGMADPAAMDAHVDAMLKELVPDATPDQAARLKAATKAMHGEMGAVHAQLEQTHQRLHALLLAPEIDRAALETARAEQVRQIDQASRQFIDKMVDAAAVLTPAQRAGIAAKLKAHKG